MNTLPPLFPSERWEVYDRHTTLCDAQSDITLTCFFTSEDSDSPLLISDWIETIYPPANWIAA